MKREAQTMDPRSLFGSPSIAPPPQASSSSRASSSSISSSRIGGGGSSGPTGRTVYDSPSAPAASTTTASHFLSPSGLTQPFPGASRDSMNPPHLSPSHPAASLAAQGFYSTSAPAQSSGFFTSSPPLTKGAPAALKPTPMGSGGKVRKGKDRAARPVLGLRVKSEDGVSDGLGLSSKARAQYSACGGCRMRRVRCDLHDIKVVYRTDVLPKHLSLLLAHPNSQEISDNGGYELVNGELLGLDGNRIACTNCQERNLRCVDGLAAKELNKSGTTSPTTLSPVVPHGPIFSASGKPKLLRKGKRVQMVQSAFGGAPVRLSASTPARAPQGSRRTTISSADESVKTESSSATRSPETAASELGGLCLTPAFLTSDFYRRFCIQRPLIHPQDFERRFLSASQPIPISLEALDAILIKVLFAWARSFGVDSDGNDDPQQTTAAVRRQRRQETNRIVADCLTDVDRAGILRRPSWDGVQILLLLLPLTEDTSTALERLAMYECALSQVAALSATGTATDGQHLDAEHALRDAHQMLVETRVYWYSFVHEGIKTGLKGGRLVLDEDEFADYQRTTASTLFARAPSQLSMVSQYAACPIKLASACRLVHRALTGSKARRTTTLNSADLEAAWTAIDSCWEEFDRLRLEAQTDAQLRPDDLQAFCDGWMVFLFECHSVIRETLYERYARIVQSRQDAPRNGGPPPEVEIGRLHAIAEGKCVAMSKSMITIIWRNLGGALFQFDAGLVRDGTYFTACVLAAEHGSKEEIDCCLTALADMRWAFSKSDVRSDHVRAIWASRLEREASQLASPHSAAFSPTQLQQPRFSISGQTRPGLGPRNISYQSELSDASYQSEQSEYTPAFFNPDDVHLPPIQGHFTGQQSPVPPKLLRGLNLADDRLNDTPMWTESYSPVPKTEVLDSGTSTPSVYTMGDSPLQSLSSGPSSGRWTGNSASSSGHPYMSPAASTTYDPRRSPNVQAAATDFYRSAGPVDGQYLASPHAPAVVDTFEPYGDDRPQYPPPTQQGEGAHASSERRSVSASYAEYYPSTT